MKTEELMVFGISALALYLVLLSTKKMPKVGQLVSKVTGIGGAGSSNYGGSVQGNNDYFYDL